MEQKISQTFRGFSKKTLTFLRTNYRENSKKWFEEHRKEFEEHVLFPLRALSDLISPIIAQIDGEIEVRPQRTVSRIYRDTRFSKDKSIFKQKLWITFKRPIMNWADFPAFFFEVGPDSYRFGMGYFSASKDTMDKIRLLIEKKPNLLMKHLSLMKELKDFVIEGEEYKRIINSKISAEYLPIYQKKNIYLVKNCSINETFFTNMLASEISDSFGKLGSLYHFLGVINERIIFYD
jgi:uncharacterized protein (TIGR02453 family)